jgi:toxin ParE1/3/4
MSARKRRLILSSQARRDIRSILLFTREQWGSHQRDRYSQLLNAAISTIHSNPLIGPSREDLGPSMRTRVVERHMIYYETDDATITVLRIMHQRIEPRLDHFQTGEGE